MITARSLLRLLAREGYAGLPDAKAIVAWMAAQGIRLEDDNKSPLDEKSIGELLARPVALTLTEDDEDALAAKEAALAAKPERKAVPSKVTRANAAMADTPGTMRERSERKSYDSRALAFMGSGQAREYGKKQPNWTCADEAAEFGARTRLMLAQGREYSQKAIDTEIVGKAMVTYDNASGGSFIPEDFTPQLISLKEQYGMIRSIMQNVPMSRDVQTFPKRTSGVTLYAPGEAGTITASTPGTGSVRLTATKLAALVRVSSEFMNDSPISAGNFLAEEFAWAFAKGEDDIGINGDGTGTYFGFTGLRESLKGLSATYANIAGIVVAVGNLYSELLITEFLQVIGRCPAYVLSPYWLVHKRFYNEVMCKLLVQVGASYGAGGASPADMAGLVSANPMFLGYPVKFSQQMPRTEANSQVCAIFGDVSKGAMFGEVRGGIAIDTSEHIYFTSDEIAFRALERIAINCHSPGNQSATEALREPGPYVGLMTAAS